MPLRLDDRYLFLGFGLFFLAAAHGIRYAITDIVSLTRIDPVDVPSGSKDDASLEDFISLQTLRTLATSPNPSIAASATSLIVQRFAQLPEASQLLARDAYSTDEKLRKQARTAIEFLRDWPSGPLLREAVSILDSPNLSPRLTGRISDETNGDVGRTPDSIPDLITVDREPVVAEMDRVDGLTMSNVPNAVAQWMSVPRERPPGTADAAELERRRRRREAMVLHEGGGHVNEDDIFRPR